MKLRPSLLKERKEFYEKEFSIKKVRSWFKERPQFFVVDLGSETGIIKDKKKKDKLLILKPNINYEELRKKLGSGERLEIIDVRESWEYQIDHIEGAINIPVSNFTIKSFEPPVAKDSEIVTVCEHGIRSEFARKVLAAKGYRVLSLDGGMEAWREIE